MQRGTHASITQSHTNTTPVLLSSRPGGPFLKSLEKAVRSGSGRNRSAGVYLSADMERHFPI